MMNGNLSRIIAVSLLLFFFFVKMMNAEQILNKEAPITTVAKTEKIIEDTENNTIKIQVLPGSFCRARLLTTGYFPVYQSEKSESYPVVLIAESNIILPNYYEADIDYMLLVGHAVGDYATARVRINITGISYIVNKKSYFQSCDGFVVDSEGMHGIKGERKDIEAELIGKSALASILSSLLKASITYGNVTINKPVTIISNELLGSASSSSIIDKILDKYLDQLLKFALPYVFVVNQQEVRVVFKGDPFELIVRNYKKGTK